MITPTGTQIGTYRIESKLGQGGMGIVLRAFDTKLNRTVAIKFLADDVADAAARRRFQREAQTASALNHPHILTVYDTGEFEDRQYLVAEYVDGGTLKDWRKADDSRAWREVVELLIGVADGLATAHVAGILHRDIKPDNILITKSGYAKLADFGLAKLMEDSPSEEITRTLAEGQTRPGTVVGTIAYMSPEQASGKPLDSRSDIFSFAVVLYEALAGRRPFAATTDLEVLQTIIHGAHQPLPEHIPAALRSLVEKALEKDPADRYQSMREVVVDLRRLTRQTGETAAPPSPAHRYKWAAAALIVLALVGATAFLAFRQQPAAPGQLQYIQLTNFVDSAVAPALSPDGKMLTFIRGEEMFTGRGEIYVKHLPDGDPVQLTRDELLKQSPVFDPTGTRIFYTAKPSGPHGDIWSVPVLGGTPVRMLTNAEALTFVPGASGSPRVLFSEWGKGFHLMLINAGLNRSDARTVYAPANPDGMAHRSYISPDGKHVLVVEMDGGWLPCRLVLFDGSSMGRRVGPDPGQCNMAAWSPDGKWMYFSANTGSGYHIWRQRFPSGAPEQVTFGATEEEGISFAPDGNSFVSSVGTRQSTLWLHDSRRERQITSQGFASLPRFSAGGKKLYYLLRSRSNRRFVSGELWSADLATGKHERMLSDFVMEHFSISPDANHIVFAAIDDTGRSPVWLATLDGSVAPRRLSDIRATRTFFGADGEVYFLGAEDETRQFVYRVRDDGTGLEKAIPKPVAYIYDVSPDGKSIAILSGNGAEVYSVDRDSSTPVCASDVCGAAGGENRGITPPVVAWSPDRKFFYLNARTMGRILAFPLEAGQYLPPLPAGGIRSKADVAALPKAQVITEPRAYVGADPSLYAFPRLTIQRNIYRIQMP